MEQRWYEVITPRPDKFSFNRLPQRCWSLSKDALKGTDLRKFYLKWRLKCCRIHHPISMISKKARKSQLENNVEKECVRGRKLSTNLERLCLYCRLSPISWENKLIIDPLLADSPAVVSRTTDFYQFIERDLKKNLASVQEMCDYINS